MKQKQDILNALQSGSSVHIKPTKTQLGGFLGTLLASIGIPLAIEAIKKITGKGAPRIGNKGKGAPRIGAYKPPPPFIGTWDNPVGMGIKKKDYKKKKVRRRPTIREKQLIQWHPTTRRNTVKPKFHKDIPLSNHDLIK